MSAELYELWNSSLQSTDFENEGGLFEEEISSIYETDTEDDEILLSESSDDQSFLLDENNQSHGSQDFVLGLIKNWPVDSW